MEFLQRFCTSFGSAVSHVETWEEEHRCGPKMYSCPLLKLLDEIILWIEECKFLIGPQIQWEESLLNDTHEYISNLNVDSDLSLRMYTKWGLKFKEVLDGGSKGESYQDVLLAAGERYEDVLPVVFQTVRESYKDVSQTIVSFMQDLEELFKVPKVEQLPHSDERTIFDKNQLATVFIGFLLQIQQHGKKSDFINSLLMELRSLIAIFGDTPFQATGTEDEQVHNLWTDFEGLANEAGRLVYSFILAPERASYETMQESLVVLLVSIELFKGNIMNFANSLPNIATPKANCPVTSLFIVDSLVCDLNDLMNRDDDDIVQIKDQIKMVHQGLMLAQSLIKDINMEWDLEIKELKERMTEIRDVSYEAEYLINSFSVGDVSLWYLTIRLNHVIHNINLIGTKLQEIKANYDIVALNLGEGSVQLPEKVMGTSKLDDDIIVGNEELKNNIMNQLVSGKRDQLQIISIFGMPGVGKTTLAKKLHDHPSVSCHFDRRAWCVVSQMYTKKNVLVDILLCVGSGIDKDLRNMEEDFLAEQIYKTLIGRRYLIVMDDVWNSNLWNEIQRFFPDVGNGSRILFTSRIINAAPSNSMIYELPILSNDQCWELLEKKVFRNEPCPPHLQEIGKEIATKCYGLPLAIVAIAGILSTKNKEESMWENVGQCLDSYFFTDQNSSIMQILKLSYKHLPQHLKPCFLLFGVFPEDAKICVKKLTQFWIAEGFIQKESNKSAESVAQEYLREFIDKSLVMVVEKQSLGGAKACIIHDLLHDLCLILAEEENFLTLWNSGNSYGQKYQHLCVQTTFQFQLRKILVPYGPRYRSLFVLPCDTSLSIRNMKLLRVLDSNSSQSKCNLVGTEFLLHLRYLAINILPNSIDRYVNLEFLIVHSSVRLSTKILNIMVKLRYLSCTTITFEEDCDTMETSNLEFLSDVLIWNPEGEERLMCFPQLQRLKCHYVMSGEENPYCLDFAFLTKCEALNVSSSLIRLPMVVNVIAFPCNVKKLSLRALKLSSEMMSIIGVLSKLEVLKLEMVAFEGMTWAIRDGEFQQLRFLKMVKLDLGEWNISSEDFTKLERLIVMDCHNLVKIPYEIGDIASLQVIEVGGWCQESAVESAREIQQGQLDLGNDELKVIIKADVRFSDDGTTVEELETNRQSVMIRQQISEAFASILNLSPENAEVFLGIAADIMLKSNK